MSESSSPAATIATEQQQKNQKKQEPVKLCEEISRETIAATKWLAFKQITYKDPNGVHRKWDLVERPTRTSSGIDAVDVLCVVKKKGENDKILLVLQYRPAVSNLCLEFPAGLVDEEDKDIQAAALREVKEECGYSGRVKEVSPVLAYEPGITSGNLRLVHVVIDADEPQNLVPQQQLEEEEWIETILAEKHNLLESIEG